MTDEEVICTWMEPKPSRLRGECTGSGQFWRYASIEGDGAAVPMKLTLDALWEVEDRLMCVQNQAYLYELRGLSTWGKTHATASQRVKALATVLREVQG